MNQTLSAPRQRDQVYYWKCDRAAAFHGTIKPVKRNEAAVLQHAQSFLTTALSAPVVLRPARTQGNHLTALANIGGRTYFTRIEDGPENDAYMEVESFVLRLLKIKGLPVPGVIYCNAERRKVPFAIQLIEWMDLPDLNQLLKDGTLELAQVSREIGASIGRWQEIKPDGFGPMDVRAIRSYGQMRGLHLRYEDYFLLNLERHLELLVASHFLSSEEAGRINQVIAANRCVLELGQACLVHKDMALWNILGTKDSIAAFIDWDDCIGGDPTDDLSLLACFHEPHVVAEAVVGYRTVRPLPDQFMTRFWMHLLRNMLVKAVIRVGAGYFNRTDDFYLINSGGTGKDFSVFTHQRLLSAITALEEQREELTYE